MINDTKSNLLVAAKRRFRHAIFLRHLPLYLNSHIRNCNCIFRQMITLILAYNQRKRSLISWRRRASGHFCRKIMALEGNEWRGPSNKPRDHHHKPSQKCRQTPKKSVKISWFLLLPFRHFACKAIWLEQTFNVCEGGSVGLITYGADQWSYYVSWSN